MSVHSAGTRACFPNIAGDVVWLSAQPIPSFPIDQSLHPVVAPSPPCTHAPHIAVGPSLSGYLSGIIATHVPHLFCLLAIACCTSIASDTKGSASNEFALEMQRFVGRQLCYVRVCCGSQIHAEVPLQTLLRAAEMKISMGDPRAGLGAPDSHRPCGVVGCGVECGLQGWHRYGEGKEGLSVQGGLTLIADCRN